MHQLWARWKSVAINFSSLATSQNQLLRVGAIFHNRDDGLLDLWRDGSPIRDDRASICILVADFVGLFVGVGHLRGNRSQKRLLVFVGKCFVTI
jgi:hypothetical protein